MVLIDLHCHTRVYSPCSGLTPEALVQAARAAGLDGVCVTEHDALWPADDLARLAGELDFPLLAAVEVSTEAGHILAYGLSGYAPELCTLKALRRRADNEGALLYLAHPIRRTWSGNLEAINDRLESLEACNGSEGPLANEAAARMAASFPLPGIGGSDAHAPGEVGTCATEFSRPVRSMPDLLRELRAGRYRAVSLR